MAELSRALLEAVDAAMCTGTGMDTGTCTDTGTDKVMVKSMGADTGTDTDSDSGTEVARRLFAAADCLRRGLRELGVVLKD